MRRSKRLLRRVIRMSKPASRRRKIPPMRILWRRWRRILRVYK